MAQQFTNREYTEMVRLSASFGDNVARARRAYAALHPNRRLPSRETILQATQRLLDYGSFQVPSHAQGRGRDRLPVVLEEEILHYFEDEPRASTREAGRRFDISHVTVWNILKRDMQHAYHYQRVQHISEQDYAARLQFCQWLTANINKTILWTDEALFTRVGLYNVHNEHWWSHRNPHKTRKDSFQVRFSVNVWAGIVGNNVLGPYFIEGRLTGTTYLQMLQSVIEDMIDDLPLSLLTELHFQQDGAPPHYARQVTDYLNNKFNEKWIGRGGPISWPPRSPDLTPLDFYLWGEIKRLVYSDSDTEINSIDELKTKIIRAFDHVKSCESILSRLKNNLLRRAQLCIEENGAHFEQLLKYT